MTIASREKHATHFPRRCGTFSGVARNLDGSTITACSWCKKNGRPATWRVDGEWTTTRPIGLVVNHGICPACAKIERKMMDLL